MSAMQHITPYLAGLQQYNITTHLTALHPGLPRWPGSRKTFIPSLPIFDDIIQCL